MLSITLTDSNNSQCNNSHEIHEDKAHHVLFAIWQQMEHRTEDGSEKKLIQKAQLI